MEGRRRGEILALRSSHFSVKDSGRAIVVHVGLEACLSSHRKEMQSRLHQNSGKRHRTSPRGENKLLRSTEWSGNKVFINLLLKSQEGKQATVKKSNRGLTPSSLILRFTKQ